jgi:hypothetical protein
MKHTHDSKLCHSSAQPFPNFFHHNHTSKHYIRFSQATEVRALFLALQPVRYQILPTADLGKSSISIVLQKKRSAIWRGKPLRMPRRATSCYVAGLARSTSDISKARCCRATHTHPSSPLSSSSFSVTFSSRTHTFSHPVTISTSVHLPNPDNQKVVVKK